MIKFIQEIKEKQRECVLFIGTQFSNLYTAVDTPARGRVVKGLLFTNYGSCEEFKIDIDFYISG